MKHKTDKVKYSFIVPVFNRPDEVEELLESLTAQKMQDFEVVVVEDGSQKPCKQVCERFADRLPVHYFSKENSGPGQSRNYGAERARGEYLVVLDSDVVLPEGYLTAVDGNCAASRAMPSAAQTLPTTRLPTYKRRFPTP